MGTQSKDYQAKLAEFEEICRRDGVPLTIQRRTVLETLVRRHDHPTADQIFDDVHQRMPGISRTTVYRVLDTFVRAGVAQRISHPGASARFDARTEHHHHLVCVECEKIIDIADSGIESLPLATVGGDEFKVLGYSIHFRGVCQACQKEQESTGGKNKRLKR